MTNKDKPMYDALKDISHELHVTNKQFKEALYMFKCIDLDGEARGDLSLSKEYKDKLEEIRRILGCKTLSDTMQLLIDDKAEYFKETLKEDDNDAER